MSSFRRSFSPCKGKTACRDDGERCLTCGRSLAEITQVRALIDEAAEAVSAFIVAQGYDNPGEFAAYFARKVEKKVLHRQALADASDPP